MTRAYAPHCDPSILHSPATRCEFCDMYPDWQAYRQVAMIAFTGDEDECGVEPEFGDHYSPGKAPCPSTWFREPRTRDAWGGNRAYPSR